MTRSIYRCLLICSLLAACGVNYKTAYGQSSVPASAVKTDSLNLFDSSRNRLVPVALYLPGAYKGGQKQKVVILSHGYNANQPGSNRGYSYITENLASNGYFVASIQHELPGDELIPTTGIPQVVRRPFWERGSANILFVLNELKKRYPRLDYDHLILIGHSNGADMTALFAQQHPELVDKIITLDNRRMALPRTAHPKIYSIRSSDQPADAGVLPVEEERVKFGITIVKLPNTIHNDMSNSANAAQRKEINDYIMQFLKE